MTCSLFNRVARLSLWLILMGLGLSSLRVSAGEKIVVGSDKSKVNPAKSNEPGTDFLKNWKADGTDPLEGVGAFVPAQPSGPVDLKSQKLQKLKQLEEKNWIFVNPGQLQQEQQDKNQFGVSDDPLEGFDKEDDSMNLMFKDYNKSGSGKQGRVPGQLSRNGKAPPPAPAREEDDDLGLGLRTSTQSSSRAEKAASVGSASQAEFRKLLESGSARSDGSAKAADSGGSLFRASSVSVLSQDQQAARDQYRNFLNGSQGGTAAGMDWRGDTRVMPGLTQSPLTPTRTSGFDNYNQAQNYNHYNSGASSPGGSDWNSGRVSGFGSLSPPNLTPAPKPPDSFSGFQPTRARGMNSFGGN